MLLRRAVFWEGASFALIPAERFTNRPVLSVGISVIGNSGCSRPKETNGVSFRMDTAVSGI